MRKYFELLKVKFRSGMKKISFVASGHMPLGNRPFLKCTSAFKIIKNQSTNLYLKRGLFTGANISERHFSA